MLFWSWCREFLIFLRETFRIFINVWTVVIMIQIWGEMYTFRFCLGFELFKIFVILIIVWTNVKKSGRKLNAVLTWLALPTWWTYLYLFTDKFSDSVLTSFRFTDLVNAQLYRTHVMFFRDVFRPVNHRKSIYHIKKFLTKNNAVSFTL